VEPAFCCDLLYFFRCGEVTSQEALRHSGAPSRQHDVGDHKVSAAAKYAGALGQRAAPIREVVQASVREFKGDRPALARFANPFGV
jgi:hypothetical protein